MKRPHARAPHPCTGEERQTIRRVLMALFASTFLSLAACVDNSARPEGEGGAGGGGPGGAGGTAAAGTGGRGGTGGPGGSGGGGAGGTATGTGGAGGGSAMCGGALNP